MNEQEKEKLQAARDARDAAHGLLAESHSRSREVEAMVAWLRAARAENHFSQRVQQMLRESGEEHGHRR